MSYRLTVYDQNIAKLFDASGQVGMENRSIRRRIVTRAELEAPRGAGSGRGQLSLAKSHRDGGELRAGPYQNRGYVTNFAPHARFVALGVKGRIRAKHTRLTKSGKVRPGQLVIPRFKGGLPKRAGAPDKMLRNVKSVRGQRPNGGSVDNNWMNRAARQVLSRYGAR